MNKIFQIGVGALFAVVAHSQAQAVTVSGVGSGTFQYQGVAGQDCSSCSLSSGGKVLDMGGFNNSTLTANTINFSAPTNSQDTVIGQLTWVNRATSGLSEADSVYNVVYRYTLAFAAPSVTSDVQAFTLSLQQTVNSAGDLIFNMSNTTLAGLGPFSLNGVTVSDLHFGLAAGSAGTYTAATGLWTNPDPSAQSGAFTSRLNIYADFTSAVPEPSTWALMIAGFAGLGLAGYRKKQGALRAA